MMQPFLFTVTGLSVLAGMLLLMVSGAGTLDTGEASRYVSTRIESGDVMSRLEDLTHRFLTQQTALNRAIELIEPMEGIVVELGLGKGRSFDHLRERLSGREIYVFDHDLSCEPEFAPPSEFRVFGEITRTLPAFCQQFAGQAVLVHSDIGTRHRAQDMPLVEFVAENLDTLLKQGGVVASDRPMENAPWIRLPELREMEHFPYYMYRKQRGGKRSGKMVVEGRPAA